jgi:hypothetical protein
MSLCDRDIVTMSPNFLNKTMSFRLLWTCLVAYYGNASSLVNYATGATIHGHYTINLNDTYAPSIYCDDLVTTGTVSGGRK